MPFIIKTQKGYIKRTSHFGPFYGNIVLTNDKAEAFRFTRKPDAETRLKVATYRTRAPKPDGIGWNKEGGFDFKKFGEQLVGEVIEE